MGAGGGRAQVALDVRGPPAVGGVVVDDPRAMRQHVEALADLLDVPGAAACVRRWHGVAQGDESP